MPAAVVELLQDSGLQDRMDDLAGSLSHGDKQWLELCMVLAGSPVLVILDEPTAGLTVEERRAKLCLELSDLLADGRLRDVQLFGGAREVQVAAD